MLKLVFGNNFNMHILHKQPKLLLHICCAGCGAYVTQILKDDYAVDLYFFNPNIYPREEYSKRLKELNKISKKLKVKLYVGKYEHNKWLKAIIGHEQDKEREERCVICYQYRLEASAKFASKNHYQYFTSTLTVSPHKDSNAISKIGRDLEKKYKIKFLDQNFKKKDGFKKASKLSKDFGLYRQNYCGCEFS